jgi:hypothetical protein
VGVLRAARQGIERGDALLAQRLERALQPRQFRVTGGERLDAPELGLQAFGDRRQAAEVQVVGQGLAGAVRYHLECEARLPGSQFRRQALRLQAGPGQGERLLVARLGRLIDFEGAPRHHHGQRHQGQRNESRSEPTSRTRRQGAQKLHDRRARCPR